MMLTSYSKALHCPASLILLAHGGRERGLV